MKHIQNFKKATLGLVFLFLGITQIGQAQLTFTCNNGTGGFTSAFGGAGLGYTGGATITFSGTSPSGCYGYGFNYANGINGFRATGTACGNPTTCTGTSQTPNPYAAAEMWGSPLVSGAGKIVTLSMTSSQTVSACVNLNQASFTASISGTTLTVTAIASGAIRPGMVISSGGATVKNQLTGTAGSTGTYTLSASSTVASTAMTATLGNARTWSNITLTLTITGGNAAQVWNVNTGTGDVYVPLTNIAAANGITITVKELASFNGSDANLGVNIPNCFEGCGSGALQLCSHLTMGWMTLPSSTASVLPTVTTSACTGYTGLMVTPANGTTPYAYAWSPATALSSTTVANPTVSTTVTSQTYTVTVTDANYCTVTASNSGAITTVAQPAITVQPVSPTGICSGGTSGSMSVTASGGTPSLTYQWQYNNAGTWGNVTNGTPAGSTYTNGTSNSGFNVAGITSAGSYQYRCIVSASGGSQCNSVTSNTATVTVVATPTGGSIAAVNYCSGTGSASVSIAGVSNATDYVWALPTGLTGTSTTSSITVSGSTAGTYTVTVTPKNSSTITCTGTQITGTVTVMVTPSGGSIATVNYCSGASSASVSITGVSNATDYVWSLPSGLTGSSTTASITVTGSTAGAYTVTVTPKNSFTSCSGTPITGTVNIFTTPSGGSIATVNYCSGAGSASVSITGVSSATDYAWSLPSGLTGSSTTASITVTGSTAGAYTVTVTPKNSSTITCTGTQITGTVNISTNPTWATNSVIPITGCAGQAVALSATVSGGSGGTVTWIRATTSGGAGSTVTTGDVPAAGTWFYRPHYSSSVAGCTLADGTETSVTISAQPSISTQPTNTSLCIPGSASFSLTATGGTPSLAYSWEYNNGGTWGAVLNGTPTGAVYSGATTNSLGIASISVAATYSYRCTISASGNGCNNITSNTVTLLVSATPTTANAGGDQTNCAGTSFTLAGNSASIGVGTWSVVSGTATITTPSSNVSGVSGVPAGTSALLKWVIANAPCPSSADTVVLTASSGANNAYLCTISSSNVILTNECSDGTWTYYVDPADHSKFLFGIQKNGNTFEADVTVHVKSGAPTQYDLAANTGASKAAFTMGRYWNVNVTSGSISTPVNVRFFYDPADLSTMQTAATAWATANPSTTSVYTTTVHTPEWFKTVGVSYNPASMQPGGTHTGSSTLLKFPTSTGTLNAVTYEQYNGVSSFSGGTVGIQVFPTPAGTVSLPVKLVSFTANPIENTYIKLDWVTATEINNKGFEVERSLDGVTFEKIGWVNGAGNTTDMKTYTLPDFAVVAGITYYYRLKEIDFDGNFEYSPVVSASLVLNKEIVLSNFIPNPTFGKTKLNIIVALDEPMEVNIYNTLGQIVQKSTHILAKGMNVVDFDFTNFAGGAYNATFKTETYLETKKVVLTK